MSLGEILHDLGEGEPLERLTWYADGVWIGEASGTWTDVARWGSGLAGGRWFSGDHGCTWVCGARVERIMVASYVEVVEQARAVCRDLGVTEGWTIGRCARELLAWIGPAEYPYRRLVTDYEGSIWGYHDCLPGTYTDAMLIDVVGCYATLWRRLPSIRCAWDGGRMRWYGMTDGEVERRAKVDEASARVKPLRNSLVGAAMGASEPRDYYCRGRLGRMAGRLGPFRPAAVAVCRSAWELCCLASLETESVYSATDSVCVLGGRWPSTWDDAGLVARVVAEGDADICTTGVYHVGPKRTVLYERGSRFRLGAPKGGAVRGEGVCGWLFGGRGLATEQRP